MTLLRIAEAATYTGLHPHTLRKYIDQGVIIGTRIGTHRFVDTHQLDLLMGRRKTDAPAPADNTAIIYARVSTRKQQANLIRQKDRLITYCREQGLVVVALITDIASGVNEHRRGLNKLFQLIRKRKARFLVVEYRDRLVRFGLGYLKEFFKDYHVQLRVVHPENGTPEEDLVQDLIALVTSFSPRIYGRRGANKIIETVQAEVKAHGQ